MASSAVRAAPGCEDCPPGHVCKVYKEACQRGTFNPDPRRGPGDDGTFGNCDTCEFSDGIETTTLAVGATSMYDCVFPYNSRLIKPCIST